MIVIKELIKKEDLLKFIKYPFDLYKNSKQWVPPIVKDELDSFDSKHNPVFEHADARFFIAIKNNKIVGRIAAIINWKVNLKGKMLKKCDLAGLISRTTLKYQPSYLIK